MWSIWALKSCPKLNKSPNLVTLLTAKSSDHFLQPNHHFNLHTKVPRHDTSSIFGMHQVMLVLSEGIQLLCQGRFHCTAVFVNLLILLSAKRLHPTNKTRGQLYSDTSPYEVMNIIWCCQQSKSNLANPIKLIFGSMNHDILF